MKIRFFLIIRKLFFFTSKLLDILLDKSKKVRSDASFEKDYLSGKYGAIPYAEFNQLGLFGEDKS